MLDEPTKRRIAKVLDEATELTRTGVDEYDAAREALTAQASNVYRELAVAAVVDSVRRRIRAETLEAERAASQRPEPRPISSELRAKWAAERDQADREIALRVRAEFDAIIDGYTQRLRVEWTTELLASELALGDGTRTTWGEATVDQLSARAEMFARNAMAGIEGAALCRRALKDLAESGAACLNDLTPALTR